MQQGVKELRDTGHGIKLSGTTRLADQVVVSDFISEQVNLLEMPGQCGVFALQDTR